jgi:transposase-like protein
MQIIHDFKITIKDYIQREKNNKFPQLSKCPHCGDHLVKHGFYTRFVITQFNTYIIFIRRYRCKHCNHTVSILPSFLLPHFQRSLNSIFQSIKTYLLDKNYTLYKRQVHFYCQRFINNIPGLISFFRIFNDSYLTFAKSKNKKATKLIKMISDRQVPTFSQRFFNHFNLNFMAL